MSNEILPGKLRANHAVSEESPIVVEKKTEKKKRVGGRLLFLMALGLGAVVVGSITLPAPVTFYGYVGSPGSIDNSGNRDDGAVISTALAASATATDGNGVVIEDNGLTKSGEMTITDYSDNSYSTELRCSIDSLPAYCSGSPVTISGLPPGKHTFTIAKSVDDETTAHSFSWEILE
ncbi:MAG: hypothetical protein M3275_07630 [Thermoproteota archaeon]|nr:hypothetical protein [Thermoproteota archaeon]